MQYASGCLTLCSLEDSAANGHCKVMTVSSYTNMNNPCLPMLSFPQPGSSRVGFQNQTSLVCKGPALLLSERCQESIVPQLHCIHFLLLELASCLDGNCEAVSIREREILSTYIAPYRSYHLHAGCFQKPSSFSCKSKWERNILKI